MSANTSHCSVFTTNVYLIFIKFDYQTVMEKASAFADMIKFYFYFLLDQNCCIHLLHRHLHLKKKSKKKNATKSDSKYVIDNMANGAEIHVAACKLRMIDAY